MIVLGFDTATAATAVGVEIDGEPRVERRHDPAAGERPGHAGRLLGLIEDALAACDLSIGDVDRLGVGVGPGSFTGLRIGVATARALAQASGTPLAGVSTLEALALPAHQANTTVLAALDARRGEAFAAAWHDGAAILEPAALAPGRLTEAIETLPPPVLAVGDGALRFAELIEPAGARIPPHDDPRHRVRALPVCRLAAEADPGRPEAVVPHYLRLPDAELTRRAPSPWPSPPRS